MCSGECHGSLKTAKISACGRRYYDEKYGERYQGTASNRPSFEGHRLPPTHPQSMSEGLGPPLALHRAYPRHWTRTKRLPKPSPLPLNMADSPPCRYLGFPDGAGFGAMLKIARFITPHPAFCSTWKLVRRLGAALVAPWGTTKASGLLVAVLQVPICSSESDDFALATR